MPLLSELKSSLADIVTKVKAQRLVDGLLKEPTLQNEKKKIQRLETLSESPDSDFDKYFHSLIDRFPDARLRNSPYEA